MSPRDGRGPDAPSVEATATSTIVENVTDQSSDLVAQRRDVHSPFASAARRRRDRMKLLLGTITDTTDKLAGILTEAQSNDDHLALGYLSWTAYVAAEFSGLLTGLGTADRRVAVNALAVSGMPTRAIAEVAGISQSTAARDVRVSHDDSADDGDVDDQTFVLADISDDEFEVALTAAREQGDLSQGNVVRLLEPRITGIDGRSYPRQTSPRTPRRRPLPDAFADAAYDVGKAVARLERLFDDDRFLVNREVLVSRHRLTTETSKVQLDRVLHGLTVRGDLR